MATAIALSRDDCWLVKLTARDRQTPPHQVLGLLGQIPPVLRVLGLQPGVCTLSPMVCDHSLTRLLPSQLGVCAALSHLSRGWFGVLWMCLLASDYT